jgi:hypothetical protein
MYGIKYTQTQHTSHHNSHSGRLRREAHEETGDRRGTWDESDKRGAKRDPAPVRV